VARWQAGRELRLRPAVELRRAPGARPGALAGAGVARLEQPLGDQLVQVVGGQRAADPRLLGGGLPRGRLRPRGDDVVEAAADRVRQAADRAEGVSAHVRILTRVRFDVNPTSGYSIE